MEEPEHVTALGFFHAPWLMTQRCFARRFREAGEQVANGIAIWNGTDARLPWKGRCGAAGPEMFTVDLRSDGVPAVGRKVDALPKTGCWIVVTAADADAVFVAKKLFAKGRLHQTVLIAGAEALKAAKAAVPGLLTGLKGEVRNDDELHAAIYADYRLVRIAKDAKLTPDKVNHFRGWRGLTVGVHAEADFTETKEEGK